MNHRQSNARMRFRWIEDGQLSQSLSVWVSGLAGNLTVYQNQR
jgi:hypothetical protein